MLDPSSAREAPSPDQPHMQSLETELEAHRLAGDTAALGETCMKLGRRSRSWMTGPAGSRA